MPAIVRSVKTQDVIEDVVSRMLVMIGKDHEKESSKRKVHRAGQLSAIRLMESMLMETWVGPLDVQVFDTELTVKNPD